MNIDDVLKDKVALSIARGIVAANQNMLVAQEMRRQQSLLDLFANLPPHREQKDYGRDPIYKDSDGVLRIRDES